MKNSSGPAEDASARPPARPRNAAATRAAILASARVAFVAHGYDGAGVREIAAGAGVTAMLVNRYFGTKEALFAEVVDLTMAEPVILTEETLAKPDATRIAAALVAMTARDATTLDGFLIMHRSASSGRAADIARAAIERRLATILGSALGGPDGAERVGLLMSLVAGLQIMRQMIALPALVDADPAALVRLLAAAIGPLLGPEGPPR